MYGKIFPELDPLLTAYHPIVCDPKEILKIVDSAGWEADNPTDASEA